MGLTAIEALQDAFVKAVEKAGASTVNIGSSAPWSGPQSGYPRRGVGSGVVYDGQGHILTNHHVVDEMEQILVTLPDGRILKGSVIGGDEETDVAVVKVEDGTLPAAEFGDSDGLRVGQPVLAIGNPLGLAGGPTVTSGVVSSLRRSLRRQYGDGLKVIQTDAAVNPGNSGGPLVDLQGRVVAITTATLPWAEGIGFAIPINSAREIAAELIEHGRVQRAYLGISGYDVNRRLAAYYGLPATARGVFVTSVTTGSPADVAGIHVGDVVTAIGGTPVEDLGDLVSVLGARKVGDSLEVEIERQGRRGTMKVGLGLRPF
ncbi:MAG TPA: trypsin-like peptidase domain-containing protein [Thermoplasmata archaeon]|nr:trypsin-like peptidase domain-containing protein [Thermoplasmata archaeon]